MTWFYARYVLAFVVLAYSVYWVRMRIDRVWLRYLFSVPVFIVGAASLEIFWLQKCFDNCSIVLGFLAVGAGLLSGLLVAAVRSYQADERRKAESTASG